MKTIAILQPIIPHYREEFFSNLSEKVNLDIYIYDSIEEAKENAFKISSIDVKKIPNRTFKGILFYNPFSLLNRKYDHIVLMLHYAHLTTWLLLLTKKIHKKKIILWGQGISVKRYLKEEKHPDWKLNWMLRLSDGAWIYMDKEAQVWKNKLPNKNIVSLSNTLTGVASIMNTNTIINKQSYKNKYGITEKRILLFCARFGNPYRRIDLLLKVIEKLNPTEFGFIIIGAGNNKPDFSKYANVYDFGAIYDDKKKKELFSIADIYFQPGWVGLSIVEAMAYGKPIFTFKRQKDILQCVEYSYITPHKNGMLFNNFNDCIYTITNITDQEIIEMGNCSRQIVNEKLSIEKMVESATNILKSNS